MDASVEFVARLDESAYLVRLRPGVWYRPPAWFVPENAVDPSPDELPPRELVRALFGVVAWWHAVEPNMTATKNLSQTVLVPADETGRVLDWIFLAPRRWSSQFEPWLLLTILVNGRVSDPQGVVDAKHRILGH